MRFLATILLYPSKRGIKAE